MAARFDKQSVYGVKRGGEPALLVTKLMFGRFLTVTKVQVALSGNSLKKMYRFG